MSTRSCGWGWLKALMVAALMVAALMATAASAAEMRTWRDSTGSFSREGEFVRLDGEVVVLRLKEGREIRVPLAKLSEADRSYVENITAKPADPKPDPAKPSEPAAESQNKPFMRITVRSYAALLDAGSYLADALQQPLVAMALPGAIAAATGGKTLTGFDVKRPLVAVVPVVEGTPQEMVVFLPFKGAKQARDTLTGIFPGSREVDGLVEMTIPGVPQPVRARFDADHAVLSTSAAALAAAAVPGGPAPTADISVRVNYAVLSPEYQATLLEQMTTAQQEQTKLLDGQLGALPQAGPALANARWALGASAGMARTLLTDAESYRLDVTADKKARKLTLDMALVAKPGTSLASTMEGFAGIESPFAPPSGAEVLDCVVSVPLNQWARDWIATTAQPAFGKVREMMAPLASQPGGEPAVRAVEAAMAAARDLLSGDRLDQRVSLFAAQQGGMQTLVMVHGEKAKAFGSALETAARALPQVPGFTITPAVKEGAGFKSHSLTPTPAASGAPAAGPMHLACGERALALTMGPESLAMGEWALAQMPGTAKRSPIVLRVDPGRLVGLVPPALLAGAAAIPGLQGAGPPGPGGDNYSNSIRGRADGIAQQVQGGSPYPNGDPAGAGSPPGGGYPTGGGYPAGSGYPDPNGLTPGDPNAIPQGGLTGPAAGQPGFIDLQVKPIRRGIQLDLDAEDGALRALGGLVTRLAAMMPPGAMGPGGVGGPGGAGLPAGAPSGIPAPGQPGVGPTIIPVAPGIPGSPGSPAPQGSPAGSPGSP